MSRSKGLQALTGEALSNQALSNQALANQALANQALANQAPGQLANGAPAPGPTVRDLQAMAAAAVKSRRMRRHRPSRAARLHLIDLLSRSALAGLAVVAGVGIFVAVTAGRDEPVRAAIWAATLCAALFVARGLASEFRSGSRNTARPFLWRAQYTAALFVVGAAFGSGAVIVINEGSSRQLALETLSAISLGALAASLAHAAYGRCAAALWVPVSIFVFLGAWRLDGLSLAIFGGAAMCAAGAAALFLVSRMLRSSAVRRFPRTSLSRRTAEDDERAFETPGEAAAALR